MRESEIAALLDALAATPTPLPPQHTAYVMNPFPGAAEEDELAAPLVDTE